jgi:hypothetical protein
MKSIIAALVLLLGAAPNVAPSASLEFAGAIFRGTPSSASDGKVPVANAVVGAQVYVRPRNAGTWIGPVTTDLYGRFTFGRLAVGTYEVRAYAQNVRLWDQIVSVPTVLPQIVVRDVTVAYYSKKADSTGIAEILSQLAFPFEMRDAQNAYPTNTIWFGDAVAIADVKALATGLVRGGVGLHAIRRFSDGSGSKSKLIEVGASPQHLTEPTLTLQQIAEAQDWPRAR